MAGPDEAAIIDPLAPGIDLAPFYSLMADERVIKVFHAARQDIEIFVKQADAVPRPLFDTQVAAMVCGYGDQVSYDQLVHRITGHQLDKTSRFTDWSRRPLSAKQVAYAIADVTYLRDVYRSLSAQLERQGRTEWVAEEMAVLSDIDTYRTLPTEAWQRLKMRVKKPRQLAILQELAAWREREAQERDVPRGRVIKDDAIYEIALQQPRDAEALARLRSIPRGFERSSTARGILAVVEEALARPEGELPRIPRQRPGSEYASARRRTPESAVENGGGRTRSRRPHRGEFGRSGAARRRRSRRHSGAPGLAASAVWRAGAGAQARRPGALHVAPRRSRHQFRSRRGYRSRVINPQRLPMR
jgi:ribonuclease D